MEISLGSWVSVLFSIKVVMETQNFSDLKGNVVHMTLMAQVLAAPQSPCYLTIGPTLAEKTLIL